MKTSTTLYALAALSSTSIAQTVIDVNGGSTTTLTGSAAISWESSFSSDLSTALSDVTASCFPFCDESSTGTGAPVTVTTGIPDGSSLASSISADVSSRLSDATADASSIGSSVSSVVASATSDAASSASSAASTGNGAGMVGGKVAGSIGGGLLAMMVGAGAVGVAAVVL